MAGDDTLTGSRHRRPDEGIARVLPPREILLAKSRVKRLSPPDKSTVLFVQVGEDFASNTRKLSFSLAVPESCTQAEHEDRFLHRSYTVSSIT